MSCITIFDVVKEGARPALVIEVTSPATRTNDVGIKVAYYHRARVPLYVIADVLEDDGTERRIELFGYQRTPRRYKRIKPDHRGWIWLDPLRLWLGVTREAETRARIEAEGRIRELEAAIKRSQRRKP